MNMTRSLIKQMIWVAVICPLAALGDQTDERLNDLFTTLKSNSDAVVQHETIANIWEIWYESGREDVDKLMQQGGEAAQSGELETAEQVFTQVTEIAPEFSEGWNRRATIRYYRHDYPGSLADIERTLALEPRHFGAVWGRGMILGIQRDFSGAIKAFERLLEISPFSTDAPQRIELLKQEMKKSSV